MVVPAIEPREVSDLRDLLHIVPPPVRAGGIPLAGWERLAVVLQTLQHEEPAVLAVEFLDRPPLSIDWSRGYFWWDVPVGTAAFAPRISRLRMARGVRLPHVLEDPNDIPQLVWLMGQSAFDGGTAWWATPGARYTLDRWPDLGSLPHTPAQMRMTALLGTDAFTVEELAAAARVPDVEAQRLITALDLLGLLGVREGEPLRRPRRASGGLFARLRTRFGD